MMDDAHLARLQDLFERAVELPNAGRAEFLQRLSGDDVALSEELRSLLEAHEVSGDFFDDLTDNVVSPAFTAVMDAAREAKAAELRPRLEDALRDTYRILEELGGGMSRVFLAEEIRLGRRVVIKVLPPELSANGTADLFRREIHLAAQLQHPHIVPVLTSGTADSLPFYTMPFVAGESLRDRLRRDKTLSVADARSIWREMLEAIEHAHANAVVHRDIKPDNVLLSGRNAMVSDFGIARAMEVAGNASEATGLTIGTPVYMAPEQLTANQEQDQRTDIYAAGLVMYEMLEGRLPFCGDTTRELVLARLTSEPSPIRRSDCPPQLAALVMRCLARSPADRPPNADAMLAELDAIASNGTPRNAIPATGRRRVAVYGVAVVAFAAASLGARRLITDRPETAAALTLPARSIAEAPRAPFRRHTPKTEAYEWYVKAREALRRGRRALEGHGTSHEYYSRAIAADSNFAAAYAGLAAALFYQGPESLPRAEEMALRSIKMDDSLAEGHAILGWVRRAKLDWKDAEEEFKKAIALDPSAFRAYEGLARVYLFTGRRAEQLAAARRAMDVDPSGSAKRELALAYYMDGHCDDAIELLRSHRDLEPPSTLGAIIGGQCYAARRMWPAAIAEFRWAVEADADTEDASVSPSFLAYTLARGGQQNEARRILSDLLAGRQRRLSAFNIAVAYAGLGDYDAAFDWLHKAVDQDLVRPYLFGPMFDELRRDPRFREVRKHMRLPAETANQNR